MHKENGFSLIELVMVIVLLGILASYALVRAPNQQGLVLSAQSDLFIQHLRHTQALAMQWGRALRVSVNATGYSVSCVVATPSQAPCDQATVIDPATGIAFDISLEAGLSLSVAGSTLDFDSLGRPLVAGAVTTADSQWQLSGGGVTRTITVSGISGRISGS